ncbi:MAG: hypothetical protein ACREDK_05540 [Thermoplasmata archaeon]
MVVSPVETVAGFLLVFVLPGFTIAKAVFPDRRLRSQDGAVWGVELAALTLVISLVVTVLVGFVLLAGAPGGFSSSWSDPTLELGLTGIVAVAFAVGVLRGAYARIPPPAPPRDPSPGSEDGWEEMREAERLAREERRRVHELRVDGPVGPRREAIEDELDRIREEIAHRRKAREADYAR